MGSIIGAVLVIIPIVLTTAILLGAHTRIAKTVQEPGRPFGAVAGQVWRNCPRCSSRSYVMAPGGIVPPCPCIEGEV